VPIFQKILVPTDGSRLSEKAVDKAIAIAKASGGMIVAMHVYPRFGGSPYGTFGPSADILAEAHVRQQQFQAEKMFAAIEQQSRAANVLVDTILVESDDVHREIIAVAKRRKCDLICMASHGRRGVAGIVLGSETQKVLTHSAIPVLVLR
jgi:nucleotide-binding universal stress UspA family protein